MPLSFLHFPRPYVLRKRLCSGIERPVAITSTSLTSLMIWKLAYVPPERCQLQSRSRYKNHFLPQRSAGPLKYLGDAVTADAVDDETLLVEAVFAEEQLRQSVAVDVDRVDQLQPRRHVKAGGIGHAGGQLHGNAFKVHASNHGHVAGDELARSLLCRGREIAAGDLGAQHDHGVIAHVEVKRAHDDVLE